MSNRIIIFDTTLRDGEQSPGFSMNLEEKLLVAELLDTMGVDVIEAGFAMASQGDFDSVKAIAERTKNAAVCSLARAKKADIERAAAAVKPAKNPRIHTFMSTSDIHLKYQFQKTQEEVLEMIRDTVSLARNYTDNVEWSAMDATRTGHDYLCKAVEVAIAAGATTINLPDTVGYGTPEDIHAMFTTVMGRVPNADKAIFSFHGQNDLGLATANTLAAIRAGARQVELTINGIGERAGNTALEEVIMTLKTHPSSYDVHFNIDTTYITRASRLIQSITGHAVQPNKAIVGANAFAHESGIHQDGMLKHSGTYEIMTPESVGLEKTSLVLGKHSGRHALQSRLVELGINLGDNALNEVFEKFKTLADKKKEIFDADLIALADVEAHTAEDAIKLKSMRVSCGSEGEQAADVTVFINGTEKHARAIGTGGVDAIFTAIRSLVPHDAKLKLYQVHSVTQGIDAQAEVTVRLMTDKGQLANGHGVDSDTLTASAKAYLNALNHLVKSQAEPKLNLLAAS